MTHDPRDVETMARLLSEAFGRRMHDDCGVIYGEQGARFLDALQAKGWKITTRKVPATEFPDQVSWMRETIHTWSHVHDAAPLTPEAGND